MKKYNRNSGEIENFPSEKLIGEMSGRVKWNGSADAMWTNIERGLDERRKAWRMRFSIHLILVFILALILLFILVLSKNNINTLL
jgi:steroid 5-alpha reductase family enzyme